MTILTRQHPSEDEADSEVPFKTSLPGETAAAAKPTTRTSATRGGITVVSQTVTDWTKSQHIGLEMQTITSAFGRSLLTPTIIGRDVSALYRSGQDIMKLDNPGYI